MVRINYHINADSLIRGNREWLGLCAKVPACTSLHIQNVIAGRQHSTIISVRVCSDPCDFFLFVPAQDEQRIIRIVFRRHVRGVFIAEIDPSGRTILQMTINKPWCRPRRPTLGTVSKEWASYGNQALEE